MRVDRGKADKLEVVENNPNIKIVYCFRQQSGGQIESH